MEEESSHPTPSWTETSVDGSAAAALALGDAAFVNERYDDALTNYTVATLRSCDSITRFRVHAHRAAAHAALKNHEDCINDTEIALDGLPIVGMLSGEAEMCWRRQGLAHLALLDTAKAKVAFEKAMQLAELNTQRVDAKVFDYRAYIEQCSPQTQQNKGALPPSQPNSADVQPTVQTSQPRDRPIEKPRYQYYQNDKTMTIAILEPNVQESDLSVECDNASIRIHLTKQGKEFSVLGGALQEAITEHRVQMRDEKVLIKLRKETPGEWHELLDPKKKNTLPTRIVASTEKSVPRPYASRKDWNEIEREIKQEEEKDKPEGEDAMNSLFQKIYADADEDTRRAMIKSYQTSGGTVLSTNWGEVGAKDYEKERTAPKGMEWKNWEGEKLPMEDDDDDDNK